MTQPLVSIVTPVFNQAEYLEATMRSVLGQDYPNIEYIVIDDGSTDTSLETAQRVAAEFAGRVTVLTQSNCGQAASLNRGWSMCRGSILAYLSSDDCLAVSAVRTMVQALTMWPDAVVAYCDFDLIDTRGGLIRPVRTEPFDARRLCVDLVCHPGPGAFFRRQVFDSTGGWLPSLRQVPDFEFWLRVVRYGPFVRVAQSLAQYRIHDRSASYRAMPAERAEEIADVMRSYWHGKACADADLSVARALTIVAKNHAQSGRIGLGALRLMQAFVSAPRLLGSVQVWRQFLLGVAYKYFGIVSVVRRFRRAQG